MLAVAMAALLAGTQTTRVEVAPKFMDGTHFACEVAFDAIVEDTAYYGGQPVALAGSYSLYIWPDWSRIFVGMKLGLTSDGTTWRAPSQAYVRNGYQTNLGEQQAQTDGENEGFRLFVYQPDGEQTMMASFRMRSEHILNGAYTLGSGTMPQLFDVELSAEQAESWGECVDALLSRSA